MPIEIKKSGAILSTVFVLLVAVAALAFTRTHQDEDRFLSYRVNPKKHELKLYWKGDRNSNFGSIQKLKLWLENNKCKLVFAMNAGMYKPDGSPQGLYIENKKTLAPLDTSSGNGNFYLKPNGVFYLTTTNTAVVCNTASFKDSGDIKYATQSGPMLVIGGQIHPSFKAGSTNLNIRNGVGILPTGEVVFVISKVPVNFYDFAAYFKNMGCKNALYLDGFVSRAYLPEKNWVQTDGNFGVMVGVAKAN
jgi:uncharacterized protein YigE (DUF2233 family)